ncbi:MAG: hypothetical protein V2A34_00560 [Lentisphaerota bacterium]
MRSRCLWTTCMAGAMAMAVQAQWPSQLSYQGRLLDQDGKAISSNVYFRVALYAVNEGGVPVHQEDIGWLPVQDGLYSFAFGTNAAGLVTALTNQEVWLALEVNGSTLTPRQRLMATPYAVQADLLDGFHAATFATGTPLYTYTELDPVWLAEKANYATGAPLYGFSEADPVWSAEKSGYATGSPVYVESDPVWLAEMSNYATGTPLYGYTEADPVWAAEKSQYATGAPLYGFTESDPVWSAEKWG